MGKRVQVRNLSLTVDDGQLTSLCAAFGSVKKANVVVDQYNGVSRGFGYVEMSSAKEAAACIESLNGQEHSGRALAVTEAPASSSRAKRR